MKTKSFRSIRDTSLLLALAGLSGLSVAASEERSKLSMACEIAVARSAAPARLREDASVYVLKNGQYEKEVDGAGPLTCIVERNHRNAIIPQCMDKAGIDSVLPAIISRSLLALTGATIEEINEHDHRQMDNGEYQGAARPGLSYMMSDYNYIYVNSAQSVLKVPPHVMFYAPNVTNADVGGSFRSMVENKGTPFVFNEGMHGYMVVYAEHRADPAEVKAACGDELGAAPADFDPFPQG